MSASVPRRDCGNSASVHSATVHSAKTDSTSASTNYPCSVSDTTEPTAVETAPTEVGAAASKSTTSTTVPGRPCYGAQGHGCDANY